MTLPAPILAVYNEDGSTGLGLIEAVASLTVSDVFCDMGALTFVVPKSTEGMQFLLADADRQVALRLPGCPDLWFLGDQEALTFISDDAPSEPVTLTMRSLAGVLDEAKVIPSGGVGTTPAAWSFSSATPGAIVSALFTALHGLGFLQNVTLAGGAVNDASGTPWPETYTVTYSAGQSLLDVVKALAAAGLLEWRMNARTLELYQPGGGLDRTLTTPLRPREDVTAAPYVRDKASIATDVLTVGAADANSLRSQSLAGRRRRMGFVSQSAAPSGSLAQVGDLFLASRAAPDVQMTHTVTDGPTTLVPWRDYRCGDRIPTLAAGPGVTVQRCMQIALAFDPSKTSEVTLEMGSILADDREVFDRKLRKLLPGDSAL